MRGTVKIRNFFPWLTIAILMACTTAQTQESAPPATTPAPTAEHAAAATTDATQAAAPAQPETIPVTTQSVVAKQAYEMGMVQREDRLFVDEGLDFFRQAVKADPQFAMGHAAVGYFTFDPGEARRENLLAVKYIDTATPDEQLLIRFMSGTKNGDLVPAISAINDLLAKYPHDKRLANLAGEWLCSNQGAFEHGEDILARLLKADPRYFPALNNLAYCYALSGQARLAPPLMDQYAAALPNEPNPQDSYGEIMRILGDYPAALEHYQKALQINPKFNASQVGIASTYALMGDEKHAREQYLVAIKGTKDHVTQLNYRILWGMTYYRENQFRVARQEMSRIAVEAHSEGLAVQEAEIHRTMALFNSIPAAGLKDLDAARAVLSESHKILPGDWESESAAILQSRAFIAAGAGMINTAQAALKPLSEMAATSRSTPVQNSYHSANGAVLFAKGEYTAAIAELQEDGQNPLSLRLLAKAQAKAGHSAEAQKTLTTLAAISDERVETAFAAPQARALLKNDTVQTAQRGAH
jgi:tetratricopeptide (TPR) repeat protein